MIAPLYIGWLELMILAGGALGVLGALRFGCFRGRWGVAELDEAIA